MVKQYPHTITIYTSGNATKNSSGNWEKSTVDTGVSVAGRFEVAKANAFVTGVDGTQIRYSGIVYLPKSASVYQVGGRIGVYDAGRLILFDIIKQFSKGQLNSRLWV